MSYSYALWRLLTNAWVMLTANLGRTIKLWAPAVFGLTVLNWQSLQVISSWLGNAQT